MKKRCVGCGKQIPSVALDCVFCKAKQPATTDDDLYEPAERSSMHATDVTMVGMRSYAEMEKAAAAESAAKTDEAKGANGEAHASAAAGIPSQARLTGVMQAVVLPPAAEAAAQASGAAAAVAVALADESAADEPQLPTGKAPPLEKPFYGLGRAVMGIGGAVMIALF